MKTLVYVAHPYALIQANKDDVERIILKLIEKFPDRIFYSPIHNGGFYYNKKGWVEGMSDCFAMMDRCDEVWFSPKWMESKGCLAEYGYATGKGMTIEFIEG